VFPFLIPFVQVAFGLLFSFITSCHGFIAYVSHCLMNHSLLRSTERSMIANKDARLGDHREAVCHIAKADCITLLTGLLPLPTRHIPSDYSRKHPIGLMSERHPQSTCKGRSLSLQIHNSAAGYLVTPTE